MIKCNQCGTDSSDTARFCSNCGNKLAVDRPIEKKPKNKILLGVVVVTLGVWMMFMVVYQVFFSVSAVDKELIDTASKTNANCPMMIDHLTRLDNVLAIPPKTIQYYYTLVKFENMFADTLLLKDQIKQNAINTFRTSPDAKFFRDHKIIINYQYKDIHGNYLFQINVTPEQYSE